VPVAAIAEISGADASKAAGALIVIGDGDFATNLYIGLLGNRDLFLNSASLGARAEELISARGDSENVPGGTFSAVYLSARQSSALFWLSVVVLPGLVMLAGTVIAWRRTVGSVA
jgi:ABC-type uncharacterized transport system involved in gliding motility auxiliary subunit